MLQELLQKIWAVAEPTLLAAIAVMFGAALAWLRKKFAADDETKAIVEAVAAVDQLMRDASGTDKKAAVQHLLSEDPRVGEVTDRAIEATVRMLPPKAAPKKAPQ